MGMGHGHFPLVSLVRAGERKRRKTKKQTNEPTNIHIPYQYVLNHWANSDPNLVWVIIVIVMSYSQFTSKSFEVRLCLWVSSYQVTSSNLVLAIYRSLWVEASDTLFWLKPAVFSKPARLLRTSRQDTAETPPFGMSEKKLRYLVFFFPTTPKNKNKQKNVKQVFWPPRASLDLFGNP